MSSEGNESFPSTDRRWRLGGQALSDLAILLLAMIPMAVLGSISAWGAAGPHGTVDLVSDQSAVQPGHTLRVGLHFRLEHGWHVYWTNPGDSGEPPRIKWNLPPGFQPGALEWPVPVRIQDHSLVDYGYPDEVLLPLEITVPSGLRSGSDVQLNGSARWLVCRDICVPAHADLTLQLPVRTERPEPPSAAHADFVKALAQLPKSVPRSWKVSAKMDMDRFILDVEPGKREAEATFFPLDPNQIENAAPQLTTPTADGIRVQLRKSDQLLKPPPRLRGVIVLSAKQGYVIDVPVTAAK